MLHFAQVLVDDDLRKWELARRSLDFLINATDISVQKRLDIVPARKLVLQVLERYFKQFIIEARRHGGLSNHPKQHAEKLPNQLRLLLWLPDTQDFLHTSRAEGTHD